MAVTVEVFHPERILSAHNTQQLLNWVSDCLSSGHRTLLIDLRYVSFIDSMGLGALVNAMKQVKEKDGRLALCSLGGQARMMIEMANLLPMFEIYSSQEEFIQQVKGTGTDNA